MGLTCAWFYEWGVWLRWATLGGVLRRGEEGSGGSRGERGLRCACCRCIGGGIYCGIFLSWFLGFEDEM